MLHRTRTVVKRWSIETLSNYFVAIIIFFNYYLANPESCKKSYGYCTVLHVFPSKFIGVWGGVRNPSFGTKNEKM